MHGAACGSDYAASQGQQQKLTSRAEKLLEKLTFAWAVCVSLQIHPSLVINMDQTGVHLVSASKHTYEMVSAADVAVVGAEDKRQITACVAASLRGDLLPLQLIFQGKTARCQPVSTLASTAARVDITCSDNHWSTQATMQRWITNVLLPHSERMIRTHDLNVNPHILLQLDCWTLYR